MRSGRFTFSSSSDSPPAQGADSRPSGAPTGLGIPTPFPLRFGASVLGAAVMVVSWIVTARADMPPVTSLLLTMVAASLLIAVWAPEHNGWQAAGRALAILVTLASAVLLVLYLTGIPAQEVPLPSPYSVMSVGLLGLASALLALGNGRASAVGATALLSATLIPLLAVLRSAPSLSSSDPKFAASIPLSSAVLILILALALVLARPHQPPLGPLMTSGALPFASLGLFSVLASWLLALGLEGGVLDNLDTRVATTVVVLLQLVVFVLLISISVSLAVRSERLNSLRHAAVGAETAFKAVTSQSPVGFAVVDINDRVRQVNGALASFLDVPAETLVMSSWLLLHPDLTRGTVDAGPQRMEFLSHSGTTAWADVLLTSSSEGEILVQVIDRTDEQSYQDRLVWLADHDETTGLLSRRPLLEALATRTTSEGQMPAPVAAITVDGIKPLIDALGLETADQILRTVANVLSTSVGPDEIVGRLSGDVFLVIGAPGAMDDAEQWARGLLNTIAATSYTEQDVRLTACAGIASTATQSDSEPAYNRATTALDRAIALGPDHVVAYTEDMSRRSAEELQIVGELRSLAEFGDPDGQMQFWYQPIRDLESRDITGFECLARWAHPTRGVLSAGEFIPAAEQDLAVISWIAGQSLSSAAWFSAQLPSSSRVTVNLSGRIIASATQLTKFVDEAVRWARMPGVCLGIEITETVAAQLDSTARAELVRLSSADCMLYLDDFGAGYSSIKYLRDLPVGTIKLDREYAVAAMESETSRRLATGMAAMARETGVVSLVEGLEDESMVTALSSAGWISGQGWHLGRPAPAQEWLTTPPEAGTPV